MPSTATDRLQGLSTSLAIKPACRCATTANITLTGLQTIDGVTVEDGNRVLVKDQTDASENGIWDASASDWTRALDFDGARDAVGGTEVNVIQGTANANTRWKVAGISTAIDISTDDITFEIAAGTSSTTQTFNANGTGTNDTTVAAILREQIRLFDYLTPTQRTAGQAAFDDSGTTAPDVAAALQAAVNDAAGNDVILPRDMRMRLDTGVARIPSAATYGGVFAPGMKLAGPGSALCVLESRVSSTAAIPYAIKCDTTAGFLFQRDVQMSGFRLNGSHASAANGTGIYLQRSYNVHLDDVYLEYFERDGIYIPILTNDQDSSNEVRLDFCRLFGCERWGLHVDPVLGSNDLSFLSVVNTTFTQCGTSAIKTIAGITVANPGVVTTSAAHGLTTGDKVYIFNVGGMVEVNMRMFTATVLTTTTFSIGSTLGYTAWTSGGRMMTQVPASGSIKGRWQMAKFVDSYITESQNVGFFIAGGAGGAYQTYLDTFTIENTAGISLLIHGCTGFIGKNLDIRSNSVAATSFAHVLLDASSFNVSGINLESVAIIANSACTPHTAFEAIDPTNLADVAITGTRFQEYDAAGQTRYGNGLWGAQQLKIEDANRRVFQPVAFKKTTLSSTAMTVTPDVRQFQTHFIQSSTVPTTAALVLAGPTQTNLPGGALSGVRLDLLINNSSTAALNLSITGSLDAAGAPANIALSSRVTVSWQYDSAAGWLRTTPWTTI